jgi:hypothetical protein
MGEMEEGRWKMKQIRVGYTGWENDEQEKAWGFRHGYTERQHGRDGRY